MFQLEDSLMDNVRQRTFHRRKFLIGTGQATVVAAVPAAVSTPSQAYDPGESETRTRYRETDHVKAFYRTNGYESLKK